MGLGSIDNLDVGVVVISSDAYSDFWPIFFECWSRNSPFTHLPVYLITATKTIGLSGVRVLNSPDLAQAAWSDRIRAGLDQIQHDFVILMTEDLLCTAPATMEFVAEVADFILQSQPTCLRLTPHPPAQGDLVSQNIYTIPTWSMHRASLQMAIWDRQRLLDLLLEGESPWEFEINATKRSRADFKFYGFRTNLLPVLEVIGRGKITRRGMRYIRCMGLEGFVQREVFDIRNEVAREWGHLKSRIFYFLPTRLQRYLLLNGVVGGSFR